MEYIKSWRFSGVHQDWHKSQSTPFFDVLIYGHFRNPEPRPLIQMGRFNTGVQRCLSLTEAGGNRLFVMRQCVRSGLSRSGSGIGAFSRRNSLPEKEPIRYSTREKEESREDNEQEIKSKLTPFIFSFLGLLLALASFYFIKASIDDEAFINWWKALCGIALFLAGQCIRCLGLRGLGL